MGLAALLNQLSCQRRPAGLVAGAQAGNVKLLIANLPEGRRAADMLAERLGVKVVVFDNFPRSGGATAFDELVRGNVADLADAMTQ